MGTEHTITISPIGNWDPPYQVINNKGRLVKWYDTLEEARTAYPNAPLSEELIKCLKKQT